CLKPTQCLQTAEAKARCEHGNARRSSLRGQDTRAPENPSYLISLSRTKRYRAFPERKSTSASLVRDIGNLLVTGRSGGDRRAPASGPRRPVHIQTAGVASPGQGLRRL